MSANKTWARVIRANDPYNDVVGFICGGAHNCWDVQFSDGTTSNYMSWDLEKVKDEHGNPTDETRLKQLASRSDWDASDRGWILLHIKELEAKHARELSETGKNNTEWFLQWMDAKGEARHYQKALEGVLGHLNAVDYVADVPALRSYVTKALETCSETVPA